MNFRIILEQTLKNLDVLEQILKKLDEILDEISDEI
jgi:hypothetical protein